MHAPESPPADKSPPPKPRRLLDLVRERIRFKHYSLRTEETYTHWIKRFIYFHAKRHPRELGAAEVTAFLNHLVRTRDVAAATQNQALSALLFLYREVLAEPLAWLDGLERSKRPVRVPTVLSQAEVTALLAGMTGTKWLMAALLYGAGLRLRECLTLRVQDVDFDYRQIVVRQGKGAKDRRTLLPGHGRGAAAGAPGAREGAARAGPVGRLWRSGASERVGDQISECRAPMGLAIRVPVA